MRCKDQVCDDILDEYLTRKEGTKEGKECRVGRPSRIQIGEENMLIWTSSATTQPATLSSDHLVTLTQVVLSNH